jgi:hypothetical protein
MKKGLPCRSPQERRSRRAQERATACADPHDGAERADLQGAEVTAAKQEHVKPTA